MSGRHLTVAILTRRPYWQDSVNRETPTFGGALSVPIRSSRFHAHNETSRNGAHRTQFRSSAPSGSIPPTPPN